MRRRLRGNVREVQLALADVKAASEVYANDRDHTTRQWNLTYSPVWMEYVGEAAIPVDAPFHIPPLLPTPSFDRALRDRYFRAVVDRRRSSSTS